MKNPILLMGAGGHARACIDVIEQEDYYTVAGLVGLPAEVGSLVLGYPVLGTDSDLPTLFEQYPYALITIGHIKTPLLRMRAYHLLQQQGYQFPIIVSPHAYVSPHASLGAGTIVMHGAVINANATIGQNCIINTQALVEHDVMMADHCHLSTLAALNSGVQVGEGTFIGSHASVRQCLTIGARTLIGMGQVVLSDCEADTYLPLIKEGR